MMILNVEILFLISNSGELSKSDSLADRANPHPSRLPAAEVDGEGLEILLIFSFWQDKDYLQFHFKIVDTDS